MSIAPPGVGTPPRLDPRLHDVRLLVRQGKIRAASDALTLLDGAASAVTFDRLDRAELVALTIDCLLARGETASAIAWGEQLADLVVGPGAATALHTRGELASAQDRHELALELHLASGAAGDGDHLPWRSGAALALVRCGRRREADDLAHSEHAAALERDDAHDVAHSLRTLATTAADGRAVGRLTEARALLAGTDSRRLAAQVDTDLAGLLVLSGDLAQATDLLRGAESYAAREDLWPLQSRVRRLLERLGETPLRLESEALAVLTNAERRVAVLALDGLSNRAIAEQLIVSVKAVEGHLSKIYRKLGVTSRRDLVATVGRLA
ncbi:MAG: hypothetical protein CMJ44_01210 [Pimelobacter sp.]|nr:hypothetical protein [Pimelobacter sp.]